MAIAELLKDRDLGVAHILLEGMIKLAEYGKYREGWL